jgi:hypothetical protein
MLVARAGVKRSWLGVKTLTDPFTLTNSHKSHYGATSWAL